MRIAVRAICAMSLLALASTSGGGDWSELAGWIGSEAGGREAVNIAAEIESGGEPAEPLRLWDEASDTPSPATTPPPPMNCSPMNPAICAVPQSEEPPPSDPAQPEPTLTLRDVASFSPGPSGLASEPSGWAIVGRPVNLIAEAGPVTRAGALLGRPVEVAFTPVSFEWTASSGERVVAGSAGHSWNELGLPALSSTDTSLRFEQPGRATVRLSVQYSAEYRFAGSGWRGIPGTLSVEAGELEFLVGTFRTVLTDGDCRANPDGPGC
ncbi:hypothetical protein Agsp01_10950 [Agromyces sp. NBRC 114283]|nr:hypothetical protein Agsp01_10950 [Agromyces sp. NBRC 114283]